jgi:hypothetical protein
MVDYYRSDILVELHIGIGSEVDPKLLVETLDILEGALYASDRNDIERAGAQLAIPTFIRDASLERLRSYRHHRIHFREAATGSIVLIGAVAAVAFFVLEKTIGEAFVDGFKETRVYGDLRRYFREQIDRKALYISEGIRRGFGARHRRVRVDVLPTPDRQIHRVIVEVPSADPSAEREVLGSLGEVLDRGPDRLS